MGKITGVIVERAVPDYAKPVVETFRSGKPIPNTPNRESISFTEIGEVVSGTPGQIKGQLNWDIPDEIPLLELSEVGMSWPDGEYNFTITEGRHTVYFSGRLESGVIKVDRDTITE